MSDPEPYAVELHCGCKPLFHRPVPAVGDWVSCLFHARGGVVVAVEQRHGARHAPKAVFGRSVAS